MLMGAWRNLGTFTGPAAEQNVNPAADIRPYSLYLFRSFSHHMTSGSLGPLFPCYANDTISTVEKRARNKLMAVTIYKGIGAAQRGT